MQSLRLGSFVGTLVCALGGPAVAIAGGDAAEGKSRSLACQACHIAVTPDADAPRLVGQREGYIAKQLAAFKAGERKHDIMQAIASQLSDADIANLAAYWSSQAPGSDNTVPEPVARLKKSLMPFPRDFPKGFVVYQSENDAAQRRVGKSYVNAIGLAAAKAGNPLPDGTIIMVVNYAAKLDASKQPVADKDGSWAIDKALSYSGMEARAGWGKDVPDLLRNDNWQYSLFTADKTPRPDLNQAVCLACHKPVASTSYVFGLKAIQAKATAK
jgi:cytochrome c553